ncbi:hypothetical protein ACGFYP_11800 [Streptomyces sp. NPDC048370]
MTVILPSRQTAGQRGGHTDPRVAAFGDVRGMRRMRTSYLDFILEGN